MHNFIYEISCILHYLVQCQCSSFYIFAGLVYGFVAQKMATILCSWRRKIKTICSFIFCKLFFSSRMLFLCIYAILSLPEYILYVSYYLKTAGWNIQYYHWKLYGIQESERFAFALLFFYHGILSSWSTYWWKANCDKVYILFLSSSFLILCLNITRIISVLPFLLFSFIIYGIHYIYTN
jgi:hypothetical protein